MMRRRVADMVPAAAEEEDLRLFLVRKLLSSVAVFVLQIG